MVTIENGYEYPYMMSHVMWEVEVLGEQWGEYVWNFLPVPKQCYSPEYAFFWETLKTLKTECIEGRFIHHDPVVLRRA